MLRLRYVLIYGLVSLSPASVKQRLTLTCRRNDGGGAQIHGRMSVIAFCNFFSLAWVNSRIEGAHFSSGEDWDSKWNDLFDFGKSETLDSMIPAISRTEISLDSALKVAGFLFYLSVFRKKRHYLIVMQSAHDFTNFHPRALEKCMGLFQKAFRSIQDSPSGGVVFHVRRGDDVTAPVRFESDEVIERRINSICRKYPNKEITVYCNSKLAIDDGRLPTNVRIDFTSSPFVAISHMVNSEILVIAKSSMSYSAALASRAVTYCPEFWHPKMSNWLSVNSL